MDNTSNNENYIFDIPNTLQSANAWIERIHAVDDGYYFAMVDECYYFLNEDDIYGKSKKLFDLVNAAVDIIGIPRDWKRPDNYKEKLTDPKIIASYKTEF